LTRTGPRLAAGPFFCAVTEKTEGQKALSGHYIVGTLSPLPGRG
jgi:hypothetical protein